METYNVNGIFAALARRGFNFWTDFFHIRHKSADILAVALIIFGIVKTEKKIAPTKDIARKLGELLAITEDAEIRNKLLKLKEAVDYGTNISTNATAEKEQQMNELLDELLQLTISKADKMIVLNKVDAAEMTWKLRSSTASSVR